MIIIYESEIKCRRFNSICIQRIVSSVDSAAIESDEF